MEGKNHETWCCLIFEYKKKLSLSISSYRHYFKSSNSMLYIYNKQIKKMDSDFSFDLNTPPFTSEAIFNEMENQINFLNQQNYTPSESSNEIRRDNQMNPNYSIFQAGSTNDVSQFSICNNKNMEQAPSTLIKQEKQNKIDEEKIMSEKSEMDDEFGSDKQGINQDQLSTKQANDKNFLPYLACQLGIYFKKHEYILSNQEHAALQRLKQTPTHLEFQNLFNFQKHGCLIQGIAEFLQPHRLKKTILASKLRNFTQKSIYIKKGNQWRMKFIKSQNSFKKSSSDLPSEERY